MEKTKIEWCDSTWNPVTGCFHGCEYCYARRMARRFDGFNRGNIRKILTPYGNVYEIDEPAIIKMPKMTRGEEKKAPYPCGFDPTFHRYRLDKYKNKKGRTIFVCSMADLFGRWVPDEWIVEVFKACKAAPQHRYLFLTKNPARYLELSENGLLPKTDNMWYGTTATGPDAAVAYADDCNMFASIEPLLEDFGKCKGYSPEGINWIIIGAETGTRNGKVIPKREWIENICDIAAVNNIPVFMKDSLIPIVGEANMKREFPWK